MSDRTCGAPDCDRAVVARGWCLKHYQVERRRIGGRFPRATPAERLAGGLQRAASGCLEWQRTRDENGYGHFRMEGKLELAHRAAWKLAFGPIPDDLNVLHRCDNPPCCDPQHLFLGTQADNVADMVTKRRHMNNRRTHCQNGHEFTRENTGIDNRGNRRCITCRRAYEHDYYERGCKPA